MPLIDWLTLDRIPGLGPVLATKLRARFGSPEAVFDATDAELSATGAFPGHLLAALRDPALRVKARLDIDTCAKKNIGIVTVADANYPPLLSAIYAPPPVLFVLGDLARINGRAAIGIVGTRKPTTYGTHVARHFAEGLAQAGVVVVSGLALGIDTVAHTACLDKGTPTVAVLGGGPEVVYPQSNRSLYERIAQEGVILSEFPPGTRPEAWNFPRRNRIIAGLSSGTLVVEAGLKSGSLITAYDALQQGRDVFAVPGSIFSPMSDGTFRLIKDGATPVREVRDILDTVREPDLFSSVAATSPNTVTRPPMDLLTDDERVVMATLGDNTLRVDQIAERSGADLSMLYTVLLTLELKGVVKQEAGQLFSRV